MKTTTFKFKGIVVAGATVLTLLAGPAFVNGFFIDNMFLQASAAEGSGKGAQGAGQHGAQGSGQMPGAGNQSGKKGIGRVLEDEDGGDDSDRPAWAGQPGGEGRPGGGGNPQPGVVKGDEYGDLIVLLRDPVTGLPVVDENGEYQVCLDPACTSTVTTVDGEVPDGVTPVEVDFGRAAVARSPSQVVDKALDDALAKLTADGVVISTDPSGRITYTVDGVTATIDSPLENLALYIDLMTGLASDSTSEAEAALGDLATLNTAAALLAGLADKTGDISLDYVFYQNLITDVVTNPDTYYDYSGFSYDRNFDTATYYVSIDGADPVLKTIDLDAYLQAVNGSVPPDGDYAALFAAAADDALEIIEFTHTQVYTELLPGTVE